MTPIHLEGFNFPLLRGDGATPEVFTFMCTATTRDLDQKDEYDDNMVVDCDTPGSVPVRQSTIKSTTWDVSGSGKTDAKRFVKIQADFDSKVARNYRFQVNKPAASGGGNYTGLAFLDSLKLSTAENGVVAFTFTLKGQGRLVWTQAAA